MKKTEKQTDSIFHALANQSRREMLDLLKQEPGCSVARVCEQFHMSRIGVMKHIQVLVDAKLVISRKSGRTRQLFFNAAPLQMIYDRWTDQYAAFWATQVVDLKYQAEINEAQHQNKTNSNRSGKKRSGRRAS